MFDEARCIVGLSPVTRDNILHFAWKGVGFNQDTVNDSNSKVFYSPVYHEERDQVARNICETKLDMYSSEIEIINTKYCSKSEREILWVTCTKGFAKKTLH